MIVNGKEYPFDPPTHRMVGAVRVDLTEAEINEIVQQWAVEFDKQQEETNQTL